MPSLVPCTALATHPDYEGERGIEFQLQPGLVWFGTSDDRAFFASNELPTEGAYQAIGGAGLALRTSVGYRFVPWISAGVTLGVQLPPAAGQYTPVQSALGASDSFSSWQLGVYARLYPLSLVNGSRDNRRVFFTSPVDFRRFDPWVSLGVDFVSSLSRTRAYTDIKTQVSWTTTYVGVPIGFGLEYRILAPLAVGFALTLTPMVNGSTSKTAQEHLFRPGTDVVTTMTSSYTPASSSNFETFFGLSARYTLTF